MEDLKQRKPIRVIYSGMDFGVYQFDETTQRYKGFGYLTMEAIKKIVKQEIDFIKLERVKNDE